MAFLSAWPASSPAFCDVRGFVVRGPLRHGPAHGVPAGTLGTMGTEKIPGDMESLVGSVRRVCPHAVRLSTVAPTFLRGCRSGSFRISCMGLLEQGQESGTHHACHR